VDSVKDGQPIIVTVIVWQLLIGIVIVLNPIDRPKGNYSSPVTQTQTDPVGQTVTQPDGPSEDPLTRTQWPIVGEPSQWPRPRLLVLVTVIDPMTQTDDPVNDPDWRTIDVIIVGRYYWRTVIVIGNCYYYCVLLLVLKLTDEQLTDIVIGQLLLLVLLDIIIIGYCWTSWYCYC